MANVLIIDDEEDVRFTLQTVLEASGHAVAVAHNGAEGMKAFRARPADLVLTDIIMPEQEGIETITQLCQHAPDVKIIAMSGGGRVGNMDFLQIARRLGAKEVLCKPIRPAELLSMIEKVLG